MSKPTPPTLADLEEHRQSIKAKFGDDIVMAYANISMTQLSIARHFGGATVQGKMFLYNPADDSLIREDVAKWIVSQKKKQAKAALKLAKGE
jgi:hypothetical protein